MPTIASELRLPTRSGWTVRETAQLQDDLTVSAILLTAAAIDSLSHVLMAQNPFGGAPRSALEPQMNGVVGWLLRKQSEFYREISSTMRTVSRNQNTSVCNLIT
jgi:hypothetical protein